MEKSFRNIAIILISICGIITSVFSQPATIHAQGGSVSNSIGNPDDAYLEFTLTGADLTLREGSTNHYVGSWTGGPITLSGKMIVKRVSDPITGGGVSYVRFYGYLHDQNTRFKWPEDEEMRLVQDRTETQEATITYTVPDGYDQPTVEGQIALEVCGANACGKYEFFFHINILPQEETPIPAQTNTPAPSPTPESCIWILNENMPDIKTSSASQDVTILVQGLNMHMSSEGLYFTHSWTPFPDVLVPGEEIALEISTEWSSDRSMTYDQLGDIKTLLVNNGEEVLETGKSGVDFNIESSGYYYKPYTYQMPNGSPFQELTLLVTADTSLGYGTAKYTYTCLNSNISKLLKFDELEDSAINFQAINGEIQVFYPIGIDQQGNFVYDEDKYELARPEMKLPVGTRIFAVSIDPDMDEKDSFAILKFSDLSTFVLQTDTLIQLNSLPTRKSNYELIHGKIKTNVNRILKGESLEVRTDRAVIGVEGTIFILEDDSIQTTLKVIEGRVTFSSLLDGSILSVNSGQMVSADANGLSPIRSFDIQAELATWPSDEDLPSRNRLQSFINNPPLWIGILALFLGLAGLGLFVFLVFIRAITKKDNVNKSSKVFRLILLIVLLSGACLTSLCGIGGLYLNLRHSSTSGVQLSPELTRTSLPQTQNALDGQTSSGAEESVLPTPQNTATQQIIGLPTPTNQPVQGENQFSGNQVLTNDYFFDDFSSPALGWPEIDDVFSNVGYENEAYFIQHKEKGEYEIVFLPIDFYPLTIKFDAQSSGSYQDGSYGVMCQYLDAGNYYYLEINLESGQYEIIQVINSEATSLLDLENQSEFWAPLTALNPDPAAMNHISIDCFNDGVSLFVNDEFVIDVYSNQPFEQDGRAAVFVYTSLFAENIGFKIILDNVEAY